ncbi:TIGR00366 family protein [Phycicoccus sp. HDW14]|uniref:TIGR00366 family protein n=1 Tax=Phycicoccus sp. HDW14 TaxID=2714941 RepID=UPI00140D9AAB|nr:TIGR00366 family protein [Phycicoccus sp. HDW14]QIM19915.1 TIGR00366 family protein [Phycicoccus sp. HDW14]
MSSTTAPPDTGERGLARVAQTFAAFTEKWFPDAWIFAALGVVIISVAALANGSTPAAVAETFGTGFWDLTAFTLRNVQLLVLP